MEYELLIKFGPMAQLHSKQRFQKSSIGNSDSHTGLTCNPINGALGNSRLKRNTMFQHRFPWACSAQVAAWKEGRSDCVSTVPG